MNIDELTLGQMKEIRAAVGAPKRTKAPPTPGRYVVVVDRGWIFAGDLSVTTDGYVRLDNAVHVFRWDSIGFAAMLKDWESTKVDLRACDSVEVPQDSIIFRVPVEAAWGKK